MTASFPVQLNTCIQVSYIFIFTQVPAIPRVTWDSQTSLVHDLNSCAAVSLTVGGISVQVNLLQGGFGSVLLALSCASGGGE